ncbi:MAG TPA: energy transducer TonB [Segetibacter sp.]
MKLHLTAFLMLIFVGVAIGQSQAERDKGIELYQQKNYQAAIPVLKSVIEEDKKDWNAWLYLGMSLAKTEKEKEALEAFRKGASYYPKNQYLKDEVFKITAKPRPNYTDLARSNSVSGIVSFAVEFDAEGKVGTIIPIKTLPGGLTENTVNVAKKIKFTPMVKDGKPITIIRIVEYSFQIY